MADKLNIPGFKHYELDSVYQAKLAAGEVDAKDLSFVKETGKIHTQGGEYGGGGVEVRILHISADGSALTEEQIADNVETYNKMMAGGKIQIFLYNGPESPLVPLALDNVVEGIIVFNHPTFLVDTEINSLMFTLKSDGSTTFAAQHTYPIGGSSVEDLVFQMNDDGTVTEEQKANNKIIYDKVQAREPVNVWWGGDLMKACYVTGTSTFVELSYVRAYSIMSSYEALSYMIFRLLSDGSVDLSSGVFKEYPLFSDPELSDTSVNAVQNKAIKAYVDNAISSAITTTLNTAV